MFKAGECRAANEKKTSKKWLIRVNRWFIEGVQMLNLAPLRRARKATGGGTTQYQERLPETKKPRIRRVSRFLNRCQWLVCAPCHGGVGRHGSTFLRRKFSFLVGTTKLLCASISCKSSFKCSGIN
jgi:hypothetical protein